jgi:perosamine synthetase
MYKIPVSKPSITNLEKKWVNKALDECQISSTGGMVEIFENKLAEKIDVKYCVAVNSGYSALFLALKALELKKGDEVILPDFTMIACPNAIIECGAKPVFVDADWDTCNMNSLRALNRISSRTRAVMFVHIYGHPCDFSRLQEFKKLKMKIVEDCAEAPGSKFRDKSVGSIGDLGCFSFYGNKIYTCGEGGAITTNNEEYAKELRRLRAYYFPKMGHFWHEKLGWNFRMSSLEAALGIAQLERWDELQERRDEIARRYDKLRDFVEIPIQREYAKRVNWYYFIKTPQRDQVEKSLEEHGVETRRSFTPMHLQPIYKKLTRDEKFPVSEKLMKEGLYLPTFPELTDKDQDFIIDLVKKAL